MIALTDHVADLMRDGILREIALHESEGFADLFAARTLDLATLAAEGWHDGAVTVATLERVALSRRHDSADVLRKAFPAVFASTNAIERPAPAVTLNDPNSSREYEVSGRTLVIHCAADIVTRNVQWLWPDRIAVGKLTLVAGQPGIGKSQLMAALAAATTTGGYWPFDGGRAPLGSVLVLSGEDDAADTQIPRLLAAGANCHRVHIVSAVHDDGRRTPNIRADLDLIERELDRIGDVRLLSIDPISSYIGKTRGNVRGVLEMVSEMAARRSVAVVGVAHFRKGEGAAINKVLGSIDFVAAARSAFMVAVDPDDSSRRLLVGIKSNIGRTAAPLAFRVAERTVNGGVLAPYIVWDTEPVEATTADAILSAAKGDRHAKDDAADFLAVILTDGPVAADAIQQEAVAAGLLKSGSLIGKDKAFRLAKDALGISQKAGTLYRAGGAGGDGGWFWKLPEAAKAPSIVNGAPVSDRGALAIAGHLSGDPDPDSGQ